MRDQLFGGRYRLLRQMGEGGMGQVWEARDETLGRLVAVKVIALLVGGGSRGDEARARFLREARITAALQHPNVVTVHDLGETDTEDGRAPFLVMELLRGEALDAVLRRGPAALPDTARWGAEICDALAAAHETRVLHRDIKPSNVLITTASTVKVLDFGIARAADPSATANHLTQTGFIVGTPPYMAPEQARGFPEARSDLYALGCLLFELITGRLPFEAPDAVGYLTAHLSQEPPAPSSVAAGIPPEWDELVLTLLRKEPGQRYASASALAQALRRLESRTGHGPSPHPPPPKPPETDNAARALRAWAGNIQQALGIARTIADKTTKAQVLAEIAGVAVAVDRDEARRIAADAERIAHTITNTKDKAQTLASVAAAIGTVDADEALRIARDAERTAHTITNTKDKAQTLASVAAAIGTVDADEALRIARDAERTAHTITNVFGSNSQRNRKDKALVLAGIAAAIGTVDADEALRIARDAERTARTITNTEKKEKALTDVAMAVAAVDAGEALRIAQFTTDSGSKALLLATIATAVAAVDAGEALRIAREAERIAHTFTNNALGGLLLARFGADQKSLVLASVAEAMAAVDAGEGLRIAQTISDNAGKALALASVAGAVAAVDPDETLRIAREAERIAHPITHNETFQAAMQAAIMELVLVSIAAAVAAVDPDEARRIAQAITDEALQASALIGVAPM
ncbi:serine/threonine-protein kinase [Streptomyces sp. NPDC020845]|uniref:serine/threonine-protein kinase n=1 Tax=Streptomyces sp. NPDC020845 TaxID=3365096 RepID=UPI0037A207CA